MRRLLFVDDDQQVLDGMRDMLRKRRRVWDMSFVASGAEALEELAKSNFDVIITDMRMPVMDGAQLLEMVCARFPNTARFVLSGQAEQQSLFRVIPFSQQFLSKPCDPAELIRVVETACELQTKLSNPKVQHCVGGITMLPVSTNAKQAILEVLDHPSSTLEDLMPHLLIDPSIGFHILKIANSAYFGTARRTASIYQASSYLGYDILKPLLEAMLRSPIPIESPTLESTVRRLQERSVACAELASRFCEEKCQMEVTYTAALLHDIGALAWVQMKPDEYETILTLAESSHSNLEKIEKELGMVTHTDIGGYLLGVAGVPQVVFETAALHHRPSEATESSDREVLLAIHVATSILEASARPGYGLNVLDFQNEKTLPQLDWNAIERWGFQKRVEDWYRIAETSRSLVQNAVTTYR